MKYSTLIKQFFIAIKSKWLLHLIKGNVFSLASFEVLSNLKQLIPEVNTIIDVGANSGQFSKAATHFYPEASIHTFEPLPDLFSKITKKFSSSPKIKLYNVALGNENGVIQFNQNKYGHISSILDISKENIHYPKTDNDLSKIQVRINSLDSLNIMKQNSGISLLKLDVQGYELEVLKGSKETMQMLNYVIIEANLEQLYTNQPTFTQINSYLNEKGFELKGMLDFNLGHKNKYIEIDLLYKNAHR